MKFKIDAFDHKMLKIEIDSEDFARWWIYEHNKDSANSS